MCPVVCVKCRELFLLRINLKLKVSTKKCVKMKVSTHCYTFIFKPNQLLILPFPLLDENVYADADRLYCTIVDDGKLGAKINDAFHANENERVYINDGEGVYSILETEPGQTSYPTPGSVNFKPAGHGYTGDSDVEYLTVLSAKSEPDQSDCSVYADLSAQRDGENQYESLVKRKK